MRLYKSQAVKVEMNRMKLSGALALCLLGWLGRAAPAQTLTIGVVDEDRLAQNYTKYKNAVSEIEKRAQALDGQLAGRQLLNDAEGKRFDVLVAKSNRTDAEATELQKLVTTGSDRQAEYIGLVGKATRTDTENARMKLLEKQAEDNKPGLQRVSDDLYNKMKQEQESTDKQFTEQANSVIRQVAEAKKLSLVVRKLAVVWSADSIDITEEVLKRLNA